MSQYLRLAAIFIVLSTFTTSAPSLTIGAKVGTPTNSTRITMVSKASCETTISGVVNNLNGTPLEGALVSIANGPSAYTDVNGAFVLVVLEPGFYFVQFIPPVPCGLYPPYPQQARKILAYECQDNPIPPVTICSGMGT